MCQFALVRNSIEGFVATYTGRPRVILSLPPGAPRLYEASSVFHSQQIRYRLLPVRDLCQIFVPMDDRRRISLVSRCRRRVGESELLLRELSRKSLGVRRHPKFSSFPCARWLRPPTKYQQQLNFPLLHVDPIGRKFDRDIVGAVSKIHRYRLTRSWPLYWCCVWRYFVKSRAESRDAVVNWELFRRKFPLRSVGWKP